MANTHILVVDDEPGVLDMVSGVVRRASPDFVVHVADNRDAAMHLIQRHRPDLVVLDLNLERRYEGLDICRAIRAGAATAEVGVIILTGEGSDDAEVALFEAGADDFVRKAEFDVRVLTRRILAVLRRGGSCREERLSHGPLLVDPQRREILMDGEPIVFTQKEFDIIHCLARHADRIVTREELCEGAACIERAIDVHICSIRRKLRPHCGLIETVVRAGYRLSAVAPGDALAA